MSRRLEYVIMLFLFLLLVILFRWSGNSNYDVISNGNVLINNRTGDIWQVSSSGKKLVSDYIPTPNYKEIADELMKEYNKTKE